jgi:formylmethanofuran dehydrogenase subunit A
MFTTPKYVFKSGELIVRDGQIVKVVTGATHVARPDYDPGIEDRISDYFDRFGTVSMDHLRIHDDEIEGRLGGRIIVQPTGVRLS